MLKNHYCIQTAALMCMAQQLVGREQLQLVGAHVHAVKVCHLLAVVFAFRGVAVELDVGGRRRKAHRNGH